MGACREGFDLKTRIGRANAYRNLRLRNGWRDVRLYVFRDTFTGVLCWLSGGCEFYWQPDPVHEPEEVFCNWCHARKPAEEDENV